MIESKIIQIDSVKPHPDNYNTHPDEQVSGLGESFSAFDQVKNIVIWRGLILAGNGFWLAMKRAGASEIEAKDVSGWDEDKALAFMQADNEWARKGVRDPAKLLELVNRAGKASPYRGAAGLSDLDITKLVREAKMAKREPLKLVDDPAALVQGARGNAQGAGGRAEYGDGQGNGSGQDGARGTGGVAPGRPVAKFPLAIVLSAEQNRAWTEYKKSIGKVADTAAFLMLFEAVMNTGDLADQDGESHYWAGGVSGDRYAADQPQIADGIVSPAPARESGRLADGDGADDDQDDGADE